MIESVLDDVIAAIEYFITKTLRKVYDNMWKSALEGVDELPPENRTEAALRQMSNE